MHNGLDYIDGSVDRMDKMQMILPNVNSYQKTSFFGSNYFSFLKKLIMKIYFIHSYAANVKIKIFLPPPNPKT